MTKLYLRTLMLCLMTLAGITASAHDCEVDGIYYNLDVTAKTAAVTYGSAKYTGSVVIPSSITYNGKNYNVTTISRSAFYGCTGLTSITIPNSVTSIGDNAFSECTGLTSITIPNSVTSIGNYAFSYCTGLEQIVVEQGNPVYNSQDNCNAIIETGVGLLIVGCKNTIIPNSVTYIEEKAFSYCTGLTSITIPNSVRSIGSSAFRGCTSLTSITIPNSVRSIGSYAFQSCSNLTSVIIGSKVSSIDYMAFYGCNLVSVTSYIQKPFKIESVFNYYSFTSATLYVPMGTKEKYEATPDWNRFSVIVEMDDELNAVDAISPNAESTEMNRYTIGGQRMNGQQKGLNIIRMSDGTTRKVVVK